MTVHKRQNNKGLTADGIAANLRRARETGKRQADLARQALDHLHHLQPSADTARWIAVLQHRIDNPEATLAELGKTMTPPMTKAAYASQLRRLLQNVEAPT